MAEHEPLALSLDEDPRRDEPRDNGDDDIRRKMEAERREEEKKEREARRRREDELRRRKREEEKWARLGSDVIETLSHCGVPPSVTDARDEREAKRLMKCWLLNDIAGLEQYGPHSLRPGRVKGAPPTILRELKDLGVLYWRISLNDFSVLNQLCRERKYKHTDEIRLHQTAKDESFLERWFQEHFHEDEQIRLVTDGSCFFDVRSKKDRWIRCHVSAGDLIVLPPGMYHRGSLDEGDFVALMRVFRNAGRWVPIYRSELRAEQQEARKEYMAMLSRGHVAQELGFL
eukprot:TRINITY_DN31065_c0_g1_i1.p1 TRINITY_DN31065_c0_g1~~TRINITY_DN31065_c0_g1_i1.p1  ORF type:complete len:287 (+),score=45.38 TRINITY_DN31065_c0_g1_i1:62-922(+)